MKTEDPIIAIIGRPNVGKSTLFNAFLGQRKSIVSDISGTTRDSLMEKIDDLGKINYWLVDTAGLTDFEQNSLETEIQTQARLAIKNADLIFWVVDGKSPLTSEDYNLAEILRKSGKEILFVANKLDDGNQDQVYDFLELGFGMPYTISAKNNYGFWDFTEAVQAKLAQMDFPEHTPTPEMETPDAETLEIFDHINRIEDLEDPENFEKIQALENQKRETQKQKEDTKKALELRKKMPIKIALVGRPNVGKSSLLNALVDKNRVVVSDVAGTTRDAIDVPFLDQNGQNFSLIDTAGIRKKGKIEKDFEFWSSVRTSRSIERADVCILLIDAIEGVTHQDLVLAGRIMEAKKGLILGVNKFDIARKQSRQEDQTDERALDEVKMWGEDLDQIKKNYLFYLQKKIKFIPWAPVSFFSAKTGKGIENLLDSAISIMKERDKRISTSMLNLFAQEIYYSNIIPMVGNKKGKMKYATQADTNPPKFLFFVNNQEAFHWSYKRYIENKIREKYGFFGTPIEIEIRDATKSFRGKSPSKSKD